MADDTSTFMELMASIVSAYVRHNPVPSAELPAGAALAFSLMHHRASGEKRKRARRIGRTEK